MSWTVFRIRTSLSRASDIRMPSAPASTSEACHRAAWPACRRRSLFMDSWIAARVTAIRRMLVLLRVSSGQVAFLVALGLVTAAFEAVGVGLFIPLLEYVEQGPRVFEESRLAAAAVRIAAPFGL